jgi:hypothetical protein
MDLGDDFLALGEGVIGRIGTSWSLYGIVIGRIGTSWSLYGICAGTRARQEAQGV